MPRRPGRGDTKTSRVPVGKTKVALRMTRNDSAYEPTTFSLHLMIADNFSICEPSEGKASVAAFQRRLDIGASHS
mgnify:FL=1